MINKQPGLFSRFYKKNPIEQLMNMSDEEITQAIDEYLEGYIKRFEQRNGKNVPLPEIELKTINDIRNKRTNISKNPIVPGRRPYK
jgi:hypothetical protein